jgi:hypothetical protein
MNQGGDRGKSPNETGTQPKRRKEQTFQQAQKPDQGRAGQGSAPHGSRAQRRLPHEQPRNRETSNDLFSTDLPNPDSLIARLD